jgi:hypothetical protein
MRRAKSSKDRRECPSRLPRGDRRSEHACNCVLNEVEAAPPRRRLWTYHPCHLLRAGLERCAWDEGVPRGDGGSSASAGCKPVEIGRVLHAARTANGNGSAV